MADRMIENNEKSSENVVEAGRAAVERHPLEPFLPEGAKVLMLGSFPPKRERWSMNFFYPNFNNDMWRIMGRIFFRDREHFVVPGRRRFDCEAVKAFCTEKGIALFDVACAVRRLRDNASDMFLEIAETTDVKALLASLPECRAVAATGGKAAEALCGIFGCGPLPVGGSVEVPLPVGGSVEVSLPVGGSVEVTRPVPASKSGDHECASSDGNPAASTEGNAEAERRDSGRRILLYRMPSSSRAHPAPLDAKAIHYLRMFSDLRVIDPAEESLIL